MDALARIAIGEDQFEEWFLAKLDDPAMPVQEMLDALGELRRAGKVDQTGSWVELMESTLLEKGPAEAAVKVMRVRADWNGNKPGFREASAKSLSALYRNDPVRKKFITNIGLEKGLALSECFRRLDTLLRLAPGLLCLDKTWGVGAIRKIDAFYERVTIDFSRKMGHEMSFGYAAEALQLVDDGHLLARQYRDAKALGELAAAQPAEVVRIALRSYGPLPVARLQEILQDGVVKPEEWKAFWEAARKVLKADPMVVIPAKRNEPITLLDKVQSYDAEWFSALATERSADGIFARLDELAGSLKPDELDAAGIRIVGERLAFLMKGFGDKDMSIRVQLLVLAREWNVAAAQVDWQAEAAKLYAPAEFLAAATSISSKRLDGLLALLAALDKTRLVETVTACIPEMTLNVLNSCTAFLLEHGEESACSGVFRELIGKRKAGVEVLFWLARRPEKLQTWGLGATGDLAFQILPALEKTYMGERLKAANQLSELVQQREWLEASAKSMNEVQRTSFIRYLYGAMGKVPVDTHAMIGRMVRVFPELAEILSSKDSKTGEEPAKGGLTSWRSYRQRQRLLEKIVNEEIPKNSRDIGVARSYGDLRENFEYKTAKEQQGILMRRSAELEQDLNTVKGTDFAASAVERAGMGTTVTIEKEGPVVECYHILGEWDQDTGLGIISCSSRMGKALAGHRVGEAVQVPGEKGEESCRITSVEPLPPSILAWAKGD